MIKIIKKPNDDYEIKMLKVWNKLIKYIKKNNIKEYIYEIREYRNVGEDSIIISNSNKKEKYIFTLYQYYTTYGLDNLLSDYYWGVKFTIQYDINTYDIDHMPQWTFIKLYNEKDIMMFYNMILNKEKYINIYNKIKEYKEE